MKKRAKHGNRRPEPSFYLGAGLGIAVVVVAAVYLVQGGSQFTAAVVQSDVIALVNGERAQNSVGQLTENALLDKAAQAKAADMAAKGYFAHVSPDGTQPWSWIKGAGYGYTYAGENLAVRFTDSQETVNAWMASPTHRANIVKGQYTETGVAVADGVYEGQPVTFVVQYFASPVKAPQETAVKKSSGLPSQPSNAAGLGGPDFSPPVSAAPVPTVAGAEAPAPGWWQRAMAYVSSVLHSLTASVAGSQQGGVDIGETGASTAR